MVLIKKDKKNSSDDGSVEKQGLPLHATTSKLHLKYRTTITQNSQKSIEWKSDNNRIKETTIIQTSRRGGDMEWVGPNSMCGG